MAIETAIAAPESWSCSTVLCQISQPLLPMKRNASTNVHGRNVSKRIMPSSSGSTA